MYTKNKALCLLTAIVVSIFILGCSKKLEGNQNLGRGDGSGGGEGGGEGGEEGGTDGTDSATPPAPDTSTDGPDQAAGSNLADAGATTDTSADADLVTPEGESNAEDESTADSEGFQSGGFAPQPSYGSGLNGSVF